VSTQCNTNRGQANRKLQLAAARAFAPMAELERRLLFCVDGHTLFDSDGYLMAGTPIDADHIVATAVGADESPIAQAAGGSATVPALNSFPGAKATLYLDFDGDGSTNWGSYNVPQTPAYDRDGDGTSFSDAELDAIRQIWARVAEKFGEDKLAELFPDSAYQLTHNALFPHDCIHVENLGGDIGLKALHNKRITLGVFPWKFKGGEAAFCRAVAFVGEWQKP